MADKKKPSIIVYAAGFAVVAIVLTKVTEPEQAKRKSIAPMPRSSASSKKKDQYLPEDYKAKFEPVSLELKNAFKPGIVKKEPINDMTPISENGIPPAFAGGEATWSYTGNAAVDGTPNALIENSANGEGVFLKPNEKWRNMTVREVSGERIVIEGPGGVIRTLRLPAEGSGGPDMAVTPLPPLGAPAPGQPNPNGLRGPIAGTDPNAMANGLQLNPNGTPMMGSDMGMDGSQRRGRRSRRNGNGE